MASMFGSLSIPNIIGILMTTRISTAVSPCACVTGKAWEPVGAATLTSPFLWQECQIKALWNLQ